MIHTLLYDKMYIWVVICIQMICHKHNRKDIRKTKKLSVIKKIISRKIFSKILKKLIGCKLIKWYTNYIIA